MTDAQLQTVYSFHGESWIYDDKTGLYQNQHDKRECLTKEQYEEMLELLDDERSHRE